MHSYPASESTGLLNPAPSHSAEPHTHPAEGYISRSRARSSPAPRLEAHLSGSAPADQRRAKPPDHDPPSVKAVLWRAIVSLEFALPAAAEPIRSPRQSSPLTIPPRPIRPGISYCEGA